MAQSEPKSIAIVGAGIAGITLAAILARFENPPSIQVFERDRRDRDQGTGFDIGTAGQKVLKRAGVFDKYFEYSRIGSDIMRFYRYHQKDPFLVLTVPKLLSRWIPPSPESNRQLLREALIETLGDSKENVHFECKVLDIRQKGNQAELLGVDGTVLGCFDLVIDASGFSSPLRKYRVLGEGDDRFEQYYTGITMLHGLVRNPEESCPPELVQRLGQGTMMIYGPRRGFAMQRYGAAPDDGRTSFYYTYICPSVSELCERLSLPQSTRFITDPERLNRVKDWMHEDLGKDWDPIFHASIDSVDAIAVRPLMQHPKNPTFDDQSTLPLIIIGDALHVVPPYTGSGGNLALDDANDVADFLEKWSSGPIDIAQLRVVEKKCMERAVEVMQSGDARKQKLMEYEKNHQHAGKKITANDVLGSYLFTAMALFLTWIYYFECLVGLRKK